MGKGGYKASALEHKYAEIPEENTSKRRKKKPSPKKAKHKHIYENCLVEYEEDNFRESSLRESGYFYSIASYCTQCGKMKGVQRDGYIENALGKFALVFSFVPCGTSSEGDKKTIDDLRKRYRVFHQKTFDCFDQKYFEI
jgi:hypothetical protein